MTECKVEGANSGFDTMKCNPHNKEMPCKFCLRELGMVIHGDPR